MALSVAFAAAGCTKNPLAPGGSNATFPQLTAPVLDAPGNDEQLSTLRPTLVVRNGTSNQNGTRTYEFQLAANSGLTPSLSRGCGVSFPPNTPAV